MRYILFLLPLTSLACKDLAYKKDIQILISGISPNYAIKLDCKVDCVCVEGLGVNVEGMREFDLVGNNLVENPVKKAAKIVDDEARDSLIQKKYQDLIDAEVEESIKRKEAKKKVN